MSKLRVHELARELGRQNREVIEFLKSKGVDVRSHMSMVDEPAVSEVKNRFRKDNNNRGKEHIAKLETPKTEEKVVTAKSEEILSAFFMHRMQVTEEKQERNL